MVIAVHGSEINTHFTYVEGKDNVNDVLTIHILIGGQIFSPCEETTGWERGMGSRRRLRIRGSNWGRSPHLTNKVQYDKHLERNSYGTDIDPPPQLVGRQPTQCNNHLSCQMTLYHKIANLTVLKWVSSIWWGCCCHWWTWKVGSGRDTDSAIGTEDIE